MRLTAFGLKALGFLAMLVVAFYASAYTNLFFLVLSFFATLLVLAPWWAASNLRGVEAHVAAPRPVPANAAATLEVTIAATRRPAFGLDLTLILAHPTHGRERVRLGRVPALAPGRTTVAVQLPALARGIWHVERANVRSSFPIGVVELCTDLGSPPEIVVHPAPAAGHDALTGGSTADDDTYGELAAAGRDRGPSALREYRPGDPMRDVHWRASARRDRLVVVETDGDASDEAVEVVWDRRLGGEPFDRTLAELAALTLDAEAVDRVVHVRTQGMSRAFGSDHGSGYPELLRWLAAVEPANDRDAPPPAGPTALRFPRRAPTTHASSGSTSREALPS